MRENISRLVIIAALLADQLFLAERDLEEVDAIFVTRFFASNSRFQG